MYGKNMRVILCLSLFISVKNALNIIEMKVLETNLREHKKLKLVIYIKLY